MEEEEEEEASKREEWEEVSLSLFSLFFLLSLLSPNAVKCFPLSEKKKLPFFFFSDCMLPPSFFLHGSFSLLLLL